MTLNRRQFLAAGAALGATASIAAPTSPLPFLIQMQSDPLLPKARGKRVVICGGGSNVVIKVYRPQYGAQPLSASAFSEFNSADEWTGFMDGAVRSGQRAAAEVAALRN